jgi:3-phenylpropionate/trans-cinnamate dioxygenase ferredoxin reductase component
MYGSKLVVVGGGMVAGYAAKQLVELGIKPGELTILSADTSIPYERPPLSKGFLAGKDTEESVRINPEDFYREHGIEVRLGCRVTAVDPNHRRLSIHPGGEFVFDKLILATGSHARTLAAPGAELGNVQYLRSLDDSKAIRQRANGVKRAVVIGGGFIGMEVTSVLAQKEIETTMVMPEDRVWKHFFTPEMSHFFETYFAARGVRFVKGAAVKRLNGNSAVDAVELADGRAMECELVVVGIGAQPAIELLGNSGIEVGDGVIVNEYLETNIAGIFAAGDIANYPDVLFKKRRRVEHWDNAVSQGQYCAKALMGDPTPFQHVPYFFSDVFDLSYEFWGDADGAGQIVHRGDLSGSSFSVWWLREGAVVAAFVMNRPDEERELAPKWIEAKQKVSAARLAQTSTPLSGAAERIS